MVMVAVVPEKNPMGLQRPMTGQEPAPGNGDRSGQNRGRPFGFVVRPLFKTKCFIPGIIPGPMGRANEREQMIGTAY
jgi:hypothetical protein